MISKLVFMLILKFVHALSKALIAFFVGFFCLIVGYGNIVDYETNFSFVQHVLSMDDMEPFFDGKNIIHRAITSPLWHHIFYNLIILFELLAGILCVMGAIIMFINVQKNNFSLGQAFFIGGATIAVAVWYFGFAVVGGEWFAMWANKWNGQMKAYTFSLFIMLSVIYILIPTPKNLQR